MEHISKTHNRMFKRWKTSVGLTIALTLGLLAFAPSAEANPQTPTCQTEVSERGERLRVKQFLPGIKIWRLDLHRTDPSGASVFQYTVKDRRNCWIVVEGRGLGVTRLDDSFTDFTLSDFYLQGPVVAGSATKSLYATWRQKTEVICAPFSERIVKNRNITKKELCVERNFFGI